MARLEERRRELEAQSSILKDEVFSAIYDMKVKLRQEREKLALLKNMAQSSLSQLLQTF